MVNDTVGCVSVRKIQENREHLHGCPHIRTPLYFSYLLCSWFPLCTLNAAGLIQYEGAMLCSSDAVCAASPTCSLCFYVWLCSFTSRGPQCRVIALTWRNVFWPVLALTDFSLSDPYFLMHYKHMIYNHICHIYFWKQNVNHDIQDHIHHIF